MVVVSVQDASDQDTIVLPDLAHVDRLARLLLPAQRVLICRYLSNALAMPERRSVRSANAHFSKLLATAAPTASLLFHAAGFTEHGAQQNLQKQPGSS